VTSGRCFYCSHRTAALDGPANHKPRLAGNTMLRVGYVIEAAEGKRLARPLLVCARCLSYVMPSNVAA
jgi:hypothetical protein